MIIFWQNTVSPHQAETISALGLMTDVRWYVDELMSESRLKQGWKVPEVTDVTVKELTVEDVEEIFNRVPEDALHVFSPRGSKLSREVARLVLSRKSRYALLMERPNGRGFKMALNQVFYRWLGWQFRRAEFTLAMGNTGAHFYRLLKFPNVFPYGYTVAKVNVVLNSRETNVYEFVYVAQLIELKNHQILLYALSSIDGDWRLTILGRGPLKDELKKLAGDLGLIERIRWIESLGNEEAQQLIADSDTLVLASNQEGWGAVVSEAVSQGTRVIVSDATGVACLCELPDAGDVFKSESLDNLREILQNHLKQGVVSESERNERSALSEKFDGRAIAEYFFSLSNGVKLNAPWSEK